MCTEQHFYKYIKFFFRTNINFKTERSGMTALMQVNLTARVRVSVKWFVLQAARYGHSRVVELLVRADPRGVNLQSEVGATPLMLVCMAPNQVTRPFRDNYNYIRGFVSRPSSITATSLSPCWPWRRST